MWYCLQTFSEMRRLCNRSADPRIVTDVVI
jgi:hypothetical protein